MGLIIGIAAGAVVVVGVVIGLLVYFLKIKKAAGMSVSPVQNNQISIQQNDKF